MTSTNPAVAAQANQMQQQSQAAVRSPAPAAPMAAAPISAMRPFGRSPKAFSKIGSKRGK